MTQEPQENAGSTDQQTGSDVDMNKDGSKKDYVTYESWNKLVDQRKYDRKKMAEMAKELDKYRTTEQERTQQDQIKRGEFEKALEQERKLRLQAEEERKGLTDSLYQQAKLYAFESELPGKLKHDHYRKHIDLNAIQIDPESGDIDQESVKSYVNNFMQSFGNDLVEVPTKKGLPSDAPGNGVPITYIDALKKARSQKEFDEIRKKYGRD